MSQDLIVGLWLGLAAVAANLPLLSERRLFVFPPRNGQAKPFWMRLLEWGLLYGLIVAIGFGFEYKVTGTRQAQDWEFYAVTLCLFAVAALPGFIYRYQLQRLLKQAGRVEVQKPVDH